MSDETLSYRLSQLGSDVGIRLHNLMESKAYTSAIPSSAVPADLRHYVRLNQDCAPFDGDGFLNFITCKVVEGGAGMIRQGNHWRFQINFNKDADGNFYTPNRRYRGEDPIGKQLKSALGPQGWGAFKSSLVEGSDAAEKLTVKLFCHHISHNAAHHMGIVDTGIPDNAGQGSSISHLCDTGGCINLYHTVTALQHVDNMARQRCLGPTIYVYRGVIVGYGPCDHDPCCTRLRVVDVEEVIPSFSISSDSGLQYLAARRKYCLNAGLPIPADDPVTPV